MRARVWRGSRGSTGLEAAGDLRPLQEHVIHGHHRDDEGQKGARRGLEEGAHGARCVLRRGDELSADAQDNEVAVQPEALDEARGAPSDELREGEARREDASVGEASGELAIEGLRRERHDRAEEDAEPEGPRDPRDGNEREEQDEGEGEAATAPRLRGNRGADELGELAVGSG
jgi:hypothetical protein